MNDDAALIEAWRGGDAQAADKLLRRHFDSLWRFFRNKADEHADELIQRTMLALLKTPEQFRGEASFRTYLFRIARHELFRFFRDRARREGRIDFEASSAIDLGASPSSVVAKRELDRALLLALRRIPLEHQIMLELHYWEDFSLSQIADILETPLGTAKSRLRRARQLLEAALSETIESAPLLKSTLDNLDEWATRLRKA